MEGEGGSSGRRERWGNREWGVQQVGGGRCGWCNGGDGRRGLEMGEGGSEERDADLGEEFWDSYVLEADPEDQFAGMHLHGVEEDDLDLSEEVDELIKGVRWLGLFRVHTTKPFSHVAVSNLFEKLIFF